MLQALLSEKLRQLVDTHGEETPELRLQAYVSVRGYETGGRVRGYGEAVAPSMVPWVQQTQHISPIRRSRNGRDYASLQSENLELREMYEQQKKEIDELRRMFLSSQHQSSSPNMSSRQHSSPIHTSMQHQSPVRHQSPVQH